jgi:predicted acyl esterase
VEVSSSNFDRYDRNPNTGKDFGLSAETVSAMQTIYHSAEHPSRITLPVP